MATSHRHRARSLARLLAVAGVLAALLRAVHLGAPLIDQGVLQGPFELASMDEVEPYAGFSPLVPFFRPQELGARPVSVTVFRRPRPRVVVAWQGERYLHIEQRRGGQAPVVPTDAEALAVAGGARWWREGASRRVVARRAGTWVEIRTDLPDAQVRRLVETLRPHAELL